MRENVRSGLIAGLIAAVIWMIITVALGFDKLPIIVGGLLFLFGTWAISTAISTVISRSRSAQAS